MFHRTLACPDSSERTQTNVQVKLLTQGNVQRADTAANRRGQRTFNALRGNHELNFKGFSGKPDIPAVNL